MKSLIKQIPFIAPLARWLWHFGATLKNIHHLSPRFERIEHEMALFQKQMETLNHYQNTTNQRLDTLEIENTRKFKELQETLLLNLYRQGRGHQYRIDQFLDNLRQNSDTAPSIDTTLIAKASETLDPFYLAFEDRFRGSRESILERCREYLPLLAPLNTGTLQAIDLGCGRGEWLQTLQSEGFTARGVDLGGAMIATCMEEGLDAQQLSAIDALKQLPDASIDLVSAFHLIEHLAWDELYALITEISRVLKPGGMVLLETPNPLNLLVATQTFYKDPTHRNPIHPDTLKFLLEYQGLDEVVIHPLHPFPPSMHLPPHTQTESRLNEWIYGAQDYLAVGIKTA